MECTTTRACEGAQPTWLVDALLIKRLPKRSAAVGHARGTRTFQRSGVFGLTCQVLSRINTN